MNNERKKSLARGGPKMRTTPEPEQGPDGASGVSRPFTIDGKPVTDEQIQAWSDEAERGYDLS